MGNSGLVAQWTRARGYEPWCRGFESLLARKRVLRIFYLFLNLLFVETFYLKIKVH